MFIPADVLFYNLGSVTPFDFMLIEHFQEEITKFTLAYKNIEFNPGSAIVYVNDEAMTIEASPFIRNEQLYIPLIEIAVLMGQAVENRREGNLELVSITPYNRFGDEVFLFLNALNSNGIIRIDGDINAVAGRHRNQNNATRTRTELIASWNITDRQSALQVILNQYEGGHNARYTAEHQAANTTSFWGDAGLLGWDLARVAQVASNSFIAGYITGQPHTK